MIQNLLKDVPAEANVGNDLTRQFQNLLDWFAETLSSEGIQIEPYMGDYPRFFHALSPDTQMITLQNLARYAAVCAQTIGDGYSLSDDKAFLWRYIKRMRLRQTSDLFSLFEKEDVIEIYDLSNFVQTFRNLRFFGLCSYTLDDILCRPFWELYRRDEKITAKIIEMATQLADQEVKVPLKYDIGTYINEEIDSPKRWRCHVENRYMTPLFDAEGRTVAMVHVMRCHQILTLTNDVQHKSVSEIRI